MTTPAYAVAERRARARILWDRGVEVEAIGREIGWGSRAIAEAVETPPTDYEADVEDLLLGWAPKCMSSEEYADWKAMNPQRGTVPGGVALKPCWDCPAEFAADMRAIGRCNGTPGPRTGQVVEERHALEDVVLPRAEMYRTPPPPEEETVSEPAHEYSETIPEATPAPDLDDRLTRLRVLQAATNAAEDAWVQKLAADIAKGHADDAWEIAARAQRKAIAAVLSDDEPTEVLEATMAEPEPELPPAPLTIDEELQATYDDVRASLGVDGETQVVEREPEPIGGGPARRHTSAMDLPITTHQQRVLEATARHGGDRKAVAKELGILPQGVDTTLEKIGLKGLLPAELIPLLPARFAKYSGV